MAIFQVGYLFKLTAAIQVAALNRFGDVIDLNCQVKPDQLEKYERNGCQKEWNHNH